MIYVPLGELVSTLDMITCYLALSLQPGLSVKYPSYVIVSLINSIIGSVPF